jgi:crotonobetainyl-CoA:carnitine CoA-transferase CaiB-like acyl-CoA transferase
VPCAPVLTRAQVVNHPQVRASNLLLESDHPVAGRLRQTRAAARFSVTPTELRSGAPLLGQHTDEVLTGLGVSRRELDALRAKGVIGVERNAA